MINNKIVLLVLPSDQGDILKDYIEWHLDLGIDLILAEDMGSSDDTREILEFFSKTGRVQWFPAPEKNRLKYRPEETLAKLAIDEHEADWIIMNDVDEFLSPRGDLRTILECALSDNITAINVSCFNMIALAPESETTATETHTLRIDRPLDLSTEQLLSGNIPPYIFIRHLPKTIVRASAFAKYGPGTHTVATWEGKHGECPELRFLHYPIRGFDTFRTKVANAVAFFEENTHLEPWWSWHWRRWIRLNHEGRLQEEYESQFLSPARAQELVRDGTCTVDNTVANWINYKNSVAGFWHGYGT